MTRNHSEGSQIYTEFKKVKRIKSWGIITLLLLAACAGGESGVKTTGDAASAGRRAEKKEIDGSRPLRILPKVNVKNSEFSRQKDLFAIKDVAKICERAAANKYETAAVKDISGLKPAEKDKLTKAMDDYAPVFPEDYKLAVDGVVKTDYNNNGFDDILVRYSVSYLKPVIDADGGEHMVLYDYKYFTALRRGTLVDLPKGDIADYYYQDRNKSSQNIIKIDGRNYLATMNKNGRLTRVDEIRTTKNDIGSHLLCELGRQK